MRTIMLASVLAFAGCAGLPDTCGPSPLPPVADWRPLESQPITFLDVDGRAFAGSRVFYAAGERPVIGYWLNGLLIAVDDDPRGPTPVWRREGAAPAGASGALIRLAAPLAPTCNWVRNAP